MNVTLIGSFVFINQGYGILSSKYHNTGATVPYPETSKRKEDCAATSDLFEGVYTTIWLEAKGQEDKTDLEITRLQNDSYELRWYVDNKDHYYGIGFLHNNELVGSYWKGDKI